MPENKITTQILALRPGKREMGIAALEGQDLVFWGVAGFRGHRQNLLEVVERRVQCLVRMYQPEVIAIEQPSQVRLAASWSLPGITSCISEVAERDGLRFMAYDRWVIREKLFGVAWVNRCELADRMAKLYPHLARYRNCSSRWQESYWLAMFMAVAVGVVCERDGN